MSSLFTVFFLWARGYEGRALFGITLVIEADEGAKGANGHLSFPGARVLGRDFGADLHTGVKNCVHLAF